METFLWIFFLLGLIVGSFLNVVIARLRTAETILGRSYCRSCRRQIAWYDNIPMVSFLALLGKCRYCKERISPRYIAVEIGTGLLFVVLAMKFFVVSDVLSWWETTLYLGATAFAVAIAVYDAKYFEIPMNAMWGMIAFVVVILLGIDMIGFADANSVWDMRLYAGMVAGLGAFAFFYALSVVSKERWMGYGDAYVAFAIGLLLGTQTFSAIVAAFIIGSVYGIMAILVGGKRLSSRVPFAPFLFLGAAVVMIFGGIRLG
jgi:prepilin signal peptidase PulO-like enzyme (type II secretory pathway)